MDSTSPPRIQARALQLAAAGRASAAARAQVTGAAQADSPSRTASGPPPWLSETGNDRWIMEHVFPGKVGGYFVECGASDGVLGSSCFWLEVARGWTGICIEASDHFYPRLVRNRLRSTCVQACLAGAAGSTIFLEGVGSDEQGCFSGVRTAIAVHKAQQSHILAHGVASVKPTVTLDSVLQQHGAPAQIDYLALDIEGSELAVLEAFPFDRHRVLAISLECDWTMRDEITCLLIGAGYREVSNPFNRDMAWERYWLHPAVVV